MSRVQKALTCVYAALYVVGLAVVCMDVYVWRAKDPEPSGAQVQAAEQARAFFKSN
jgi:hypothetical protein